MYEYSGVYKIESIHKNLMMAVISLSVHSPFQIDTLLQLSTRFALTQCCGRVVRDNYRGNAPGMGCLRRSGWWKYVPYRDNLDGVEGLVEMDDPPTTGSVCERCKGGDSVP